MAESHEDDFRDEEIYEDHGNDIAFFQRSEWLPTADDNEDPQAAPVNEEERDVLPAESFDHGASLEGGNPQQLREPVRNFCAHSVQTPFPGFWTRIFLVKKNIPDKNKALCILYMIPDYRRELMKEIIYGEPQDGEVRLLSFHFNGSKMQDFHTLFLENGQQIKVSFKITNAYQQNVFRREEYCQQSFDGFQIRAESQSRVGKKGSKATFCVQYVGECEEEGEITLTYHSNPVMSIRLLFAISNY